jgi:hypothetical protein
MSEYYTEIHSFMSKNFSLEVRTLIGDFSILWNLYEKYLFNNKMLRTEEKHSGKYHELILKKFEHKLVDEDFINIIDENYKLLNNFFMREYISFDCDSICRFFNVFPKQELKLLFDEEDYFIDTVINRLHLLLIIIFRVRNNMFHGSKQVIKLEKQKELFVIGCNIIALLLHPIEGKLIDYER